MHLNSAGLRSSRNWVWHGCFNVWWCMTSPPPPSISNTRIILNSLYKYYMFLILKCIKTQMFLYCCLSKRQGRWCGITGHGREGHVFVTLQKQLPFSEQGRAAGVPGNASPTRVPKPCAAVPADLIGSSWLCSGSCCCVGMETVCCKTVPCEEVMIVIEAWENLSCLVWLAETLEKQH